MSKLEPTRTYSNLTATEELRRLLDECGVKWKAWDGVHPITVWHDKTYLYEFVEYRLVNGAKQVSDCPSDNDGHCELTIKVFNCTPEQAIAATLGAGTCEADETDTIKCWVKCKDEPSTEHMELIHVMECSECGHTYEHVNGDYEFCPRCGRKRVNDG